MSSNVLRFVVVSLSAILLVVSCNDGTENLPYEYKHPFKVTLVEAQVGCAKVCAPAKGTLLPIPHPHSHYQCVCGGSSCPQSSSSPSLIH